MTLPDSLDAAMPQLRSLRLAVLRLHKGLLDFEKVEYEQFYGRIQSPNEFFKLVTEHEWFNWLRPMSQLIVQMDDVLRSKQPVTLAEAQTVLQAAQQLLHPAEEGTLLQRRYYRAVQRSPEVALLHADVARSLPLADEP